MKTAWLVGLIFFATTAYAKTVRHELTVTKEVVNFSGKKNVDFALLVNKSLPAPTLEFTEGDDAEITVINKIPDEEVSIHWHGILLPPEEDGVAYLNTPPIFSGQSRVFKFKIRQNGTYWYHSHTNVQEQKGVLGAIVIHPKVPKIKVDKDLVVVLSDWSDENPVNILKNLRKDGDFYLFKKNSMRSYFGAIRSGGLKNQLMNEWMGMGGMDLSDVGYDAFLINGKRDSQLATVHPGEKIRLRIINAAGSSYFIVSLGGLPMQVIAADGVDVKPVHARQLLMGMAETYDVLFTPPEHKNYELRATVQDVTGHASAWIGMGDKVYAPDVLPPDMYAAMDHSSHNSHGAHGAHGSSHGSARETNTEIADHASHEQHAVHDAQPAMNSSSAEDHSHHGHLAQKVEAPQEVVDTLTVDNLSAVSPTAFAAKNIKEVKLVLDGDMRRYVWHINGKAIHEDRYITIDKNDVIRIVYENKTMMHHPMHLHGHFFRVLNDKGERSPLKHTVDVPPMGSRTIEFIADEPGQWMLHCHNLYHMKTGMGRVVKYSSWSPSIEMQKYDMEDPHRHDHWYSYGRVSAASNRAEGFLRFSQTWNEISARIESRKDDEWDAEGDLLYRRWFGAKLSFIAGGTSFDKEEKVIGGVGYFLPMLIEAKFMIDGDGDYRIDLERRFQWTKTVFSMVEFILRKDQPDDYTITLSYQNQWPWYAGLVYTGLSWGAGLTYQF